MKNTLFFLVSIMISICVQAQFWTQVDSDFPTVSTGISRFSIATENIAWGIGYNGINPNNNIQQFSKTTDGGITWEAGAFNVGNVGLGIGDITAIDSQTALITAYPRAAGQTGGVWKTSDGGTTWNNITTAAFNNVNSFANSIHLFNSTEGVVMGDPINNEWEIYTTIDGGNTFTSVPSSNIPAPQSNETGYLAQKAVVGNSIWFTTSKGRIYHSSDKGLNWVVYSTPISDFGGTNISGDLSFSNATKGILQTQAGVLYRTSDAGATWSIITTSGTGSPYGDNIAYVPGSAALVSVGSNPAFAGSSYSLDDGVTWTNIDDTQHVDIALFDPTTGYSGGFTNGTDNAGVFVISSSVLTSALSGDEYAFAKAYSLFPNPTSDRIQISSQEPIVQLELLTLRGQKIKEKTSSNQLSLEGLANGMYFIKITTSAGNQTLPVIKK